MKFIKFFYLIFSFSFLLFTACSTNQNTNNNLHKINYKEINFNHLHDLNYINEKQYYRNTNNKILYERINFSNIKYNVFDKKRLLYEQNIQKNSKKKSALYSIINGILHFPNIIIGSLYVIFSEQYDKYFDKKIENELNKK